MSISDRSKLFLRAVLFLLLLGGMFSVFQSVEKVGTQSDWDGCVSGGEGFTRTCYVTWQVGEFDTGVPLVLKRYESGMDIGINTSGQSSDESVYLRIFKSESFLYG